MRYRNKLSHSLISLSKELKDINPSRQQIPQKIIKTVSQILKNRFQNLKLSAEHLIIISRLFDKTIGDKGRVEPLSLLHEIYGDSLIVMDKLDLIIDLMDNKIIECDKKKYMKISRKDGKFKVKYDKATLIDVYIGFSEYFISFVLNNKNQAFDSKPKPFKSNREFLEQWFLYLDDYVESRSRMGFYNTEEYEAQAIVRLNEITTRLDLTRRKIPFIKIVKDYRLTEEEQIILMYVLRESLEGKVAYKNDILDILGNNKYDKFTTPSILLPSSTLMREQLLIENEDYFFYLHDGAYDIAPDIGAAIVKGERQSEQAVIKAILASDDIFSYQKPVKILSQIILPLEQKKIIKEGISKFYSANKHYLKKWGIVQNSDNFKSAIQSEKGLLILLHGPPGTGKTALANAIAKHLKKSMLATDISKIVDKWVGNSEKNVSKLFTTYRKICKRLRNTPVLLLNEADQLLSFRGGISDSVDRMYNQMQNILLENLEKFEGILIATTNLISNIDDAFSRRFDLKLKLDIPDQDSRKKIWKILIPKELPMDADVNLNVLVTNYKFTGGQIELVIRNAASAAACRMGTDCIVKQSDLLKYAELENNNSFDKNNRKAIGFD